MKLCMMPKNVEGSSRQLTCLQEHQEAHDLDPGCFKHRTRGRAVPTHSHIDLNVRKSKRKRLRTKYYVVAVFALVIFTQIGQSFLSD